MVLIILATISINAVLGENGLIKRAEKAGEHYANAEKSESDAIDELLHQAGVATGEIIENPYEPDGWKYAWVCDNGTWGDKLETGATLPEGEGIVVAKFYETGKKITPPDLKPGGEITVVFNEGNEYVIVIEGQGEMGALVSEDGSTGYAWQLEIQSNMMAEPEKCTLPYVSEIIICDGITSICTIAFTGDTSLKKVTIGNNVEMIGDMAFGKCDNLGNLTIPDSVTSIGNHAFYECTTLTNIRIPDNVTSIGEYAFANCDNLTNITIGNSVESIEYYAFGECSNLTTLIIDSKEIVSTITSSDSNGHLVRNATTIYINEEIEEANIGSYIKENYTKQATSDKAGYVKYTK